MKRIPSWLLVVASIGVSAALAGCAGVDESGEPIAQVSEALDTPSLVATPSSVDFGRATVGGSATATITLTNRGTAAASSINVVPPDPYHVTHNPPSFLPVDGSGDVDLNFSPTTAGTFSGTVVVHYADGSGNGYSLDIPVTGIGL